MCEAAVTGAGFDERERRACGSEKGGHLGNLRGDELAEQWPEIGAGHKIARGSGSTGRAGVVTKLVVIQRAVHERGDRERAAFMDLLANEVEQCQCNNRKSTQFESAICTSDVSAYSFRMVTNTSPSPRHTRMRAMRPDATF